MWPNFSFYVWLFHLLSSTHDRRTYFARSCFDGVIMLLSLQTHHLALVWGCARRYVSMRGQHRGMYMSTMELIRRDTSFESYARVRKVSHIGKLGWSGALATVPHVYFGRGCALRPCFSKMILAEIARQLFSTAVSFVRL
jgi:hypothetical protein